MRIKFFKFSLIIASFLVVFSCNKSPEEQITEENPITQEDIESYAESSSTGADEIDYTGTFAGTVKGKEVELKLKKGNSFSLKESGKSFKGSWWKLDDGTVIELETEEGKPKTQFYMWSDNDNWIALNDSAEIPEKEEFIKRK